MKVKSIMTQPLQTCTVDMNLSAASRRMKATGCGTLGVLNHRGRLAGIMTDRDLALAIGSIQETGRSTVRQVMTRPVHTCRPEDDVHGALDTMAMYKVRRLPVISEAGDVEGIISIDDIILWGMPKSAVSLHTLVAALRSIGSASLAAVQETAAP